MAKVLVLTSTFPRWKDDSTPGFVYELSNRLGKYNQISVLSPHAPKALKAEKIGNLDVYRFVYCFPSLERLAYGAGIIPNFKASFLAKIQVPFFLLSELYKANKLAKKLKPDLLHAHWILPQGFIGAILKRKYKIPLVVTIHGSDLFPIKNFILKLIQKFAVRHCNVCTVNSEATRQELVKRFPEYKDKVVIIPMGVDIKGINNRLHKTKITKKEKDKLILFVGRISEQKGIKYLIRAAKEIRKKFPNVKVLIIGDGKRDKLEKLANSLGLSNNVSFLGGLPHSKVIDYYNKADVFVFPAIESSIGTEALGLVVLEAMASKVPVVTTNTGGLKYIIKHGENGMVAKQKNPDELAINISRLLSDRKLREKCIRNAFELVRKDYSWDFVVKKFQEIYLRYTKKV